MKYQFSYEVRPGDRAQKSVSVPNPHFSDVLKLISDFAWVTMQPRARFILTESPLD